MKLISTLLLLLTIVVCQAQNFTYPFQKYISSGDYSTASDKIKDKLRSNPKDIESLLASAVLYSRPDYKRHNSEKAYKAAITALNILNSSSEKQLSKLSKNNITPTTVYQFINQIKDEYFTTLTDAGKNSEQQMAQFIKRMKNAPSEHIEIIQAKLDSICNHRKIETARAKFLRDSITFSLFDEADRHRNIKRMISLYKENPSLRDSVRTLLAIHSYFADYGDTYAFKKFYNLFNNDFLHKPYYSNGQSIASHDSLICELYKRCDLDIHAMDHFIREAAPSLQAIWGLQSLLKPYIDTHDWQKAYDIAISYAPQFGNDKRYVNIINTLKSSYNTAIIPHQLNFLATHELNSQYSPKISADNKHIYLCASDIKNNHNYQQEMIYELDIKPNGQINREARIITPISLRQRKTQIAVESNSFTDKFTNSKVLIDTIVQVYNNTAPEAISTSGLEMLFFHNGDLRLMQKTHQGWKAAPNNIKINIENLWQADLSLASNGRAVLFASHLTTNGDIHNESYDKHEHANIFVCELNDKGEWSDPIDLGPTINTMGCERSPFLHPDMKTLYFTSNGHGSLGGLDMFVSTRLADTCWTCWSEPVNLGKEYNTSNDDWQFQITTDGTKAYFARDIEIPANLRSKANHDTFDRIFYVNLTPEIQPDKVATISGKVLDSNNNPVNGEIVWEDLSNGLEIGRSTINNINGEFFIVLPRGKNYGYYIHGNGIFPLSGNADLREITKFQEINVDFNVYSLTEMIKKNIPMPLNNLFFNTGEATLLSESKTELTRVAQLIITAQKNIEISGHSDTTGSPDHNQQISEERANAVRDYLISLGCNPEQIKAIGYGSSKPIATNTTLQGRQKNRRVEIRFDKE